MLKVVVLDQAVRRRLDKLIDNEKARKSMLLEAAQLAQRELETEAEIIKDKGLLKTSISRRVGADRAVVTVGASYGRQALEEGQKPGSRVNMKALQGWASRKLGNAGLAYAVAKKIKEQGSRKYRMGGPKQYTRAFQNTEKGLPKLLKNILKYYD